MKKLFLIFLFIYVLLFLINDVSAVNLKISPAKIEFNASVNEKVCQKIYVGTDSRDYLIGSDRWTKSLLINKKDISQYDKNASEIGLKIEYAEKLIILDDLKKEVEVCLTAEKAGKYNGALFYSTKNSIAGVGIWISADISEEKSYFNRLNARVIEAFSYFTYEKTEDMLIFLPIILFIFLIILMVIRKKQKDK